ncbi:pilus assembly protein [Georgenia sp. 10Sc9-8]|uniref:Pilus assembly protein n=1 Tax=Georgenia halotolerans TaxID=3028317 RepID=A0ABT5TTH4_9MICO|nr:pilus assembly protein [Georgenia halotolerans]
MVEFLGTSLVLLVPLVYLVLVLGQLQAGAFAAEAAARESGRILARADDLVLGRAQAVAAVELAFADQGLAVDGAGVLSVACDRDPCRTPGARMHVTVALEVDLPLVPDVLGGVIPTAVPVRADHVAVVDRFAQVP